MVKASRYHVKPRSEELTLATDYYNQTTQCVRVRNTYLEFKHEVLLVLYLRVVRQRRHRRLTRRRLSRLVQRTVPHASSSGSSCSSSSSRNSGGSGVSVGSSVKSGVNSRIGVVAIGQHPHRRQWRVRRLLHGAHRRGEGHGAHVVRVVLAQRVARVREAPARVEEHLGHLAHTRVDL